MTETGAIVRDRAHRMGIPMSKVAVMAGVTRTTLYRKMKNPNTFIGWELRNIFSGLRVPMAEREKIMKEVLE